MKNTGYDEKGNSRCIGQAGGGAGAVYKGGYDG